MKTYGDIEMLGAMLASFAFAVITFVMLKHINPEFVKSIFKL